MILKRPAILTLSILLAVGLLTILLSLTSFSATAVSSDEPSNGLQISTKLTDDLRQRLATISPGEAIRVIVHFTDEIDLTHIERIRSQQLRQITLIQQLQQTAVSSQSNLRTQLDIWQKNELVEEYHPFWIINAIAVTGPSEIVHQIAARPDVVSISLDGQHRYFDPPTDSINIEFLQTTAVSPTKILNWGLDRINAPAVWHGLGIDGSDITVAIMDSGVDWLHPDLYPNYRGNLGNGNTDHSGNWFHTNIPTYTEPIDLLGHGTHVAGTAVGQNGLGVAPGANWIAVSIADQHGLIYDSDVHAGFEWLMAPNGDPSLAPDIINNSWGGNPYATTFQEDVAALNAAGIIAIFAAGNNGPFTETVNSPASITGTIAIAASDDIDSVAWFSSRGPSPLTSDQTPWIAAPGTKILSALPGGLYGTSNGTSMATPHAVGTIALLLSANPTLSEQEIAAILADTAVPITPLHPNNDSGWGRLDAYAALQTQAEFGTLQGIVQSNGLPLIDAIVTITTTNGATLEFITDGNGRFQASLRSGVYEISTEIFGYTKDTGSNVAVTNNQTTTHHLNLSALPTGTISGVVQQAISGKPLTATVSVQDTPVFIHTDADGRYNLELPSGQYKLQVEADGHRLGRATILTANDQTLFQDFSLETAPTILLVDSGKWYYNSYIDYYQNSLNALNRKVDTWTIRNPFEDVPTLPDLVGYDTVIWSNPQDSPGYIGAGTVISDYLGLGGDFLVSGQHVGSHDGQGFNTQIWWYRHLGANFIGKTAVTATLSGASNTLFSGMSLTLNEDSSAENQIEPDQSRPRTNTLTRPTFVFDDGLAGGLQAGHCQPFRIAYFGFGLEGIGANERADILDRSFDYFASPRLTTGLQWIPDSVDDFAVPGSQMVYTLTVQNLSETVTDTLHLNMSHATWTTELVTETLTLGACQTGQTVLTITVPADAPIDFEHHTLVTAVSSNNPTVSGKIDLRHKTPSQILLVDDDRWYDQRAVYQSMLDSMGLTYDVWEIGRDDNVRGSPPQAILNAYDFVFWYTAYDWFAPITPAENDTLTHYLAQGGRLFLTSQDFLYYNHQTPLASDYFEVIEYREMITPTHLFGAGNATLPPNLAGPLPLNYSPYQNFSDGIVTAPDANPFIWLDKGIAGGIAASGEDWRTIFMSFPLEKLSQPSQNGMMNGIVGWLSDLGETSFTVDQRSGQLHEPRTFTVTLHNLKSAPTNQVIITNTLPVSLTLLPETISGNALYNPATRQLTWNGDLGSGESHVIAYQARPMAGLGNGTRLDNQLQLYYRRHDLTFERTATIWVNAPDFSGSTFTAVTKSPQPQQHITYTLRLFNDGSGEPARTMARIQFSEPLTPAMATLFINNGDIKLGEDNLVWEGVLPPGNVTTITLALERELTLERKWLPATAVISDSVTTPILLYNQLFIPPYTQYFPLIGKSE